MKKTGVFYGSTTGTTESVARMIANKQTKKKKQPTTYTM